MKYCTKCGAEIMDEAVICPNCGCATAAQSANNTQSSEISGLKVAAKVLMIISCIVTGIYLIPLCWTIPMTVHYSKCIKGHQKVGAGFKICTLLFVNLLSGILMLCDNQD